MTGTVRLRSMRVRTRGIAGAVALAAGLAGLSGCARERRPVAVEIRWTADTRGELEACGCRARPLGGLARRATRFAEPAAQGAIVVRLDAGAFAGGSADYERLALAHLVRAYGAMRYDAVNLAAVDLAAGAEAIRAWGEAIPLVSANAQDAEGRPLAPAFRVIEREGLRIAIIGLAARGSGDGVHVADPSLALARHMPELARRGDARILLADLAPAGAEGIARKYPEIDLILLAGEGQPFRRLRRANRSRIALLAGHGKFVASTRLTVGSGGIRPGSEAHAVAALSSDVPEEPGVAAIVRAYKDAVRRADLAIDHPPPLSGEARYIGARACEPCHPRAYGIWEASAHARALEALRATGDDGDPRCLRCHVLGLGQADGYRRKETTPFRGVECESCHGRGSAHAGGHRKSPPGPALARPTAGDCEVCHDGVQSDPFDLERLLPAVEHRERP